VPVRLSLTSEFEIEDAARLLQVFLDTVHIYNPILEVPVVQGYIRNVRLNGLGWDAPSCLLVIVEASHFFIVDC
jgi:hypothetical protein